MTINGISGGNTQAGLPGMNQATDSYSRNIRNQIASAQKQLQELSSDENMTLEEKMKKRQEIQQEISNLNQQLRQHQIEQRKEQQTKGSTMEDMLGGNRQVQKKTVKAGMGMSDASMQAIISADASMEQVQVQSQVKSSLEGRAGVLKAEIKQDAGRNTEAKEAELADLENKVNSVTSAQMSALSDINRKLEESAKEDAAADKSDVADEKETAKTGNGIKKAEVDDGAAVNAASDTEIITTEESITTDNTMYSAGYNHVDIKL